MASGITKLFRGSLLISVFALFLGPAVSGAHSTESPFRGKVAQTSQFQLPQQSVSAVVLEAEDFEDVSNEVDKIAPGSSVDLIPDSNKKTHDSSLKRSFLSKYFGRIHLLNIPPPSLHS
ncbi:hypothetical protein EBQ90_10705 [bacterium]|nr:hypothetical protein [bacterium]